MVIFLLNILLCLCLGNVERFGLGSCLGLFFLSNSKNWL